MDVPAPWCGCRWQGLVRNGRLLVADWPAWTQGQEAFREAEDLPALITLIEDGVLPSGAAGILALAYRLIGDLFSEAELAALDGETVDVLLANRCDLLAPLVAEPPGCYVMGRLQDVAALHCYDLTGPELAARLFMEVRRIDRELQRRQEQIAQRVAERLDSWTTTTALLADAAACCGVGSDLVTACRARCPQLGLCAEDWPALAAARDWPCCAPWPERLLCCARAVSDRDRVVIDAALADPLAGAQAAGVELWLVVPRLAWRVSVALPGRSLGLDAFTGVITETWSETLAETAGVAAWQRRTTPPAF